MVARVSFPTTLVLALLVAAAACESTAGRDAFHALVDEVWRFELEEDPLLATRAGHHEYDDRLPSVRAEDIARRTETRRGFLERLRGLDREALEGPDRVSYDVLARKLEDDIRNVELGGHLVPFTSDSGFHTSIARLPQLMTFRTPEDYRNYIARLRAIPTYFGQYMELLRAGIETGMTLPRVVLEGFDVTIRSHVVDEPEASVFYEPFRRFPVGVPEEQRADLEAEGSRAIMESVVPAYLSLLAFMENQYVPKARTSLGASELPNGREYYAYLIRHFTTLDKTADDIHALGLSEVSRIEQEMRAVMDEVGFTGAFGEFLDTLRRDPRFYVSTPEALLKEASYIAKRMDGKLPSLFGRLPRLPYGIEPVPEHLAPKYTGGRYVPPALGSTQAGTYWVNTYRLDSRPLYTLEALTLHEAVPGHHLQYALALELTDVPEFRRFVQVGAFGEGWGLYAERLGLEAGFYQDPYSNFGRLTYEMWRACRLVVDTGLHAKGWSREQAIDYLASHTALSLHECTTETDRYISWPGQALSYKMGELEIRRLRRMAEEALGERFDVRAFHDAVLANGPVPLPVLAEQIEGFVRRVQQGEEE